MLLAAPVRRMDANDTPASMAGEQKKRTEQHTNIVFMGGIHGVGKTTYCRALAPLLQMNHLTAGDLIREAGAAIHAGKAVADVDDNQARLIASLHARVRDGQHVLLDGHFCLLDRSLAIVPVHLDVFRQIRPDRMLIMEGDATEVAARLRNRDGKGFELPLIEALAKAEREHANFISEALRVPLMTVSASTRFEEVQFFLE